jgi:predicted DNA-binding protein with PD1-like motif
MSIELIRTLTPKQSTIGRMARGVDIIHTLEQYCDEHQIRTAWVQCLGAVDKATISYYDQQAKGYHHHPMSGELEIVSCYGNITQKEGKAFAHLHGVFSNEQFQCFGGHLWPGTTSVFLVEFHLQTFFDDDLTLDAPLCRLHDESTGLFIWQ